MGIQCFCEVTYEHNPKLKSKSKRPEVQHQKTLTPKITGFAHTEKH